MKNRMGSRCHLFLDNGLLEIKQSTLTVERLWFRISQVWTLIFQLILMILPNLFPTTVQAATYLTDSGWGKMPLTFIANQGQMDSRIVYYVQGGDKTLYFTQEGITFALLSQKNPAPYFAGDRATTFLQENGLLELTNGGTDKTRSERWIVRLNFVDANPVQPIGQYRAETVFSYFKGPREEWRTGLPTYSSILYRNLWDGIDLVYSGTLNRLKYEFVVKPGADPGRIRFNYHGAAIYLNEAQQLEVSTPAGGFKDSAPLAYQEIDGHRVPVGAAYALEDGVMEGTDSPRHYGFQVGAYDPTRALVIDPAVLVYCGYVGGSNINYPWGIAIDTPGHSYVTGWTESTEATFPVTTGPDLTYNGDRDAFVAKVKADGTGLVYAGYIGGSGSDEGHGIAVDSMGYAYITGFTSSTEATFPVLIGPNLKYNGYWDAFVAKVKADGTGLVYAGYIGGSGSDESQAIAVDPAGNAYITGFTSSTEATFPVLIGPDLTYNGNRDAFVAKVKADGTGLVYAGYIGGSGSDEGHGIAVDPAGNAYVTGVTQSTEATFPVLVGPDLTYNGNMDAFVAKVKADGTGLVYAGYIGGSGGDEGHGIAIDSIDHAYVTGWTESTEATFPVKVGPHLTHNGGNTDAFVAKVRADGAGLVYAGYIGGSSTDHGHGIAVDSAGQAYVTGETSSTEATFPVIDGPDLTYNGNSDAFVAKVKTDGTGLVYAGYIGGFNIDGGRAIAVDSVGNVYVTGVTYSNQNTFPVIVGPDLTYNGDIDAFVAKVSYRITPDFYLYLPLIKR